MSVLGAIVFVLLAAIALLHLAWGFGLCWPAANERELVALVVGANGHARMPGATACAVAAACIFSAGVVALLLGGWLEVRGQETLVNFAGLAVFFVFAVRGAFAYRIYFGPLCLCIACAFAFLLLERMRTG